MITILFYFTFPYTKYKHCIYGPIQSVRWRLISGYLTSLSGARLVTTTVRSYAQTLKEKKRSQQCVHCTTPSDQTAFAATFQASSSQYTHQVFTIFYSSGSGIQYEQYYKSHKKCLHSQSYLMYLPKHTLLSFNLFFMFYYVEQRKFVFFVPRYQNVLDLIRKFGK